MKSFSQYSKAQLLIWLVLAVGLGLRVWLGLVNYYANDDHLAVSEFIVQQGRAPMRLEIGQAYHPRLYHSVVAVMMKVAAQEPRQAIVRAAQFLNVAAGIATLWLVIKFLQGMSVSNETRLVAFSLVALNPRLIGINTQATNDSFVILFATMALFFGSKFFRRWRMRDFVAVEMATILAALAKGNGLVVFFVLGFMFLVTLFEPGKVVPTRRWRLFFCLVFVLAVLIGLGTLGPYVDSYRDTGSFFSTSLSRAPWPHFFEKTFVRGPGVTSVADSLLTFRIIDLVRQPHFTYDVGDYPLHRTSIWSLMYGRLHFLQYNPWPPEWAMPSSFVFMLGRLIFILALLPTLLFVVGLMRAAVRCAWCLVGNRKNLRERMGELLLVVSAFAFLTMIVWYAFDYRGVSAIKVIYILPGLLAYAGLFGWEYDRLTKFLSRIRFAGLAVRTVIVLLLVTYVGDVLLLIGHLM